MITFVYAIVSVAILFLIWGTAKKLIKRAERIVLNYTEVVELHSEKVVNDYSSEIAKELNIEETTASSVLAELKKRNGHE